MPNSFKQLEIYTLSLNLFYEVHPLSLQLPKYELYELGSQLRRSANSVNTNIVEGFGRRRYKSDFLKFLVYAHSSNDETLNHLEKIFYLYPRIMENHLHLQKEYNKLGGKLNSSFSTWRIPGELKEQKFATHSLAAHSMKLAPRHSQLATRNSQLITRNPQLLCYSYNKYFSLFLA